jgi:light-regulated signal transduction histidine kinase (bacteriophytochrome)
MTQAPTDSLDLSRCADEPIRTPGSIQPHGFLLTLSPADLVVQQASANLAHWIGLAAESVLGLPLAQVVGDIGAARVKAEIEASPAVSRPAYIGTITAGNGAHFDVLVHAWDSLLILEFEGVDRRRAADFRHLYPLIGDFLVKVNQPASIPEMSELAARRVREVSGYGRVLVYQFDSDGHGRVLAESKEDGYES